MSPIDGKYGSGVYFTDDIHQSDRSCDDDREGLRHVILSRVVVGSPCLTNRYLRNQVFFFFFFFFFFLFLLVLRQLFFRLLFWFSRVLFGLLSGLLFGIVVRFYSWLNWLRNCLGDWLVNCS